jgi:hypothetical protein
MLILCTCMSKRGGHIFHRVLQCSPPEKTDRQDIIEILLKISLNTMPVKKVMITRYVRIATTINVHSQIINRNSSPGVGFVLATLVIIGSYCTI